MIVNVKEFEELISFLGSIPLAIMISIFLGFVAQLITHKGLLVDKMTKTVTIIVYAVVYYYIYIYFPSVRFRWMYLLLLALLVGAYVPILWKKYFQRKFYRFLHKVGVSTNIIQGDSIQNLLYNQETTISEIILITGGGNKYICDFALLKEKYGEILPFSSYFSKDTNGILLYVTRIESTQTNGQSGIQDYFIQNPDSHYKQQYTITFIPNTQVEKIDFVIK